jgi:hypothetical protein
VFEIGRTLREARERQGLDLAVLAHATKIRRRHLQALEDERFDLLPEPAYVRGFLRAYADALDLDARLVVEEYDSRLPRAAEDGGDPDETPAPEAAASLEGLGALLAPRRPRRGRRIAWTAGAAAAGVALLAWLASLGGSGGSSLDLRTRTPPPIGPAGAAAPAAPARRASSVTLTVTGSGVGSWLAVHRGDAGGPTVFSGIVQGGERRRFRDPRRLWISVGWTPRLHARVNGRPAPLRGGTASFVVTPRGVSAAQ